MPEIDDAELRLLLDAVHRGFWGAYSEALPRVVRDLARARGIDIEAVNRATDERLRNVQGSYAERGLALREEERLRGAEGLDLSPEAVLRVLGEDYR